MSTLFQQLQSQMAQAAPKQNLMQLFLQSSNQKDFLQNMVKSNPKLEPLWNMISQSNLSPKQLFYQYAQNNNVNPDEFLESLKK